MITYHEWAKHLRDAALIDQSAGKLGIVAACSGIPEGRLQQWLNKQTTLSHAEFLSLHETLAERHVIGLENETKTETSNAGVDACIGNQSITECSISFDESD